MALASAANSRAAASATEALVAEAVEEERERMPLVWELIVLVVVVERWEVWEWERVEEEERRCMEELEVRRLMLRLVVPLPGTSREARVVGFLVGWSSETSRSELSSPSESSLVLSLSLSLSTSFS